MPGLCATRPHPRPCRAAATRARRRGASLLEIVIAIGLIAIVAFAGFRAFGSKLLGAAQGDARATLCVPSEVGAGAGSGCDGVPGSAPGGPNGGGPIALNGPVCTSPGQCSGGTSCFVAGTLVMTREGPQPIEQIHAGDLVVSADPARGAIVLEPVAATFVTPDRQIIDLYLKGDPRPIRVTPGHRFFTLDAGWVVSEDLVAGEPLVRLDGEPATVDHLDAESALSTVYNFEVEETHTYFVADEAILVHNPLNGTGDNKIYPAASARPPINGRPGRPGNDGTTSPIYNYSPPPGNTAVIQLSSDRPGSIAILGGANGYHTNIPGSTLLTWNELEPPSTALNGIDHIVIVSHGSPGKISYGNPPRPISGDELAGILKGAGYTPGDNSEIFVSACNGATACMPNLVNKSWFWGVDKTKTPSVTQGLANGLGLGNVIGPAANDPEHANKPPPNQLPQGVLTLTGIEDPAKYPPPGTLGHMPGFGPSDPKASVYQGTFQTCQAQTGP